MATIQPSECAIFVQIWVDTNALQNGSTTGVYLVDSNHHNGSSGEGTPGLATHAALNDKICWTVLSDNVNWDGDVSIQNFGNAGVFGAGGTPKSVDGSTWTGQVMKAGSDQYTITFNAEPSGGTGITTEVNPSLVVN